MRQQLILSDKSRARLERLKGDTNAASFSEVVTRALEMYADPLKGSASTLLGQVASATKVLGRYGDSEESATDLIDWALRLLRPAEVEIGEIISRGKMEP